MLKSSVSTAKLFAQTGTPELHALLSMKSDRVIESAIRAAQRCVKTAFDSVAAPPPIQSTKLDPGDRLSGVPATGPWSISHHAGHEACVFP